MSAKWEKKLTKYTKKYLKKVESAEFDEKEMLVFRTLPLLNVNSLIYFEEAIGEMSSKFTGIQKVEWRKQLAKVSEEEVEHIHNSIIQEYLEEKLNDLKSFHTIEAETGLSLIKLDACFSKFIKGHEPGHLIDKVFKDMRLEHVKDNEVVVLAFQEIIINLYERYNKNLVILMHELEKTKNPNNSFPFDLL